MLHDRVSKRDQGGYGLSMSGEGRATRWRYDDRQEADLSARRLTYQSRSLIVSHPAHQCRIYTHIPDARRDKTVCLFETSPWTPEKPQNDQKPSQKTAELALCLQRLTRLYSEGYWIRDITKGFDDTLF